MIKKRDNYIKNNKTYLNKKTFIKEYFKEINKIIPNKKGINLLDVACASGDFIYYLNREKKNIFLCGLDYSPKLLRLAKKKVPSAIFYNRNLKNKINLNKKFDYVTCLGTMSAFDDWHKPLKNLFNLCKKNGVIILYDPINIYNIDTILRYKKNKTWVSGFNLFSKNTIIKIIKEINKNSKIKFKKFTLKKKLPRKKDTMRAWTTLIDKEKRIMVGTSQILDFHIIKVKNV